MTLAKFSTLTSLIFILFGCNHTSSYFDDLHNIDPNKNIDTISILSTKKMNNAENINDKEDKIIDTIFKLREVKREAKYIEQQTKNERHLIAWVADTPHLPDQKYYWIKVGEDMGTHLVTYFHFYVYPDSMRIMYYDVVNDKEITLSEWRKINGI